MTRELNAARAGLSVPGALGWSLSLTVALNVLALATAKLLGASRYTIVALAVLEVVLYVGAARFIARSYAWAPREGGLGLQAVTPLQLLIGASLGVVLHLPAGYLDALAERRFPTPREHMLEQLSQLTPASHAHAALLFLSIAVLAPLAEELFFRGALFGALLKRAPAVVAIWTTSLAFMLAHQEPRTWAPLLLVALVLAELRLRSRSIWPGTVLHGVFNATTLSSVFATRPAELTPPDVSWLVGLGGGVLSLGGVWLFRRVSRHATPIQDPR